MSISWPTVLIAVGSIIAVIGAFWAAIEQTSADRELRALATKNTELSEELRNSVTGGESFPIATYGLTIAPKNDPNRLTVYISIEGNYPLFDVTFEHFDLTEPLSKEKLNNTAEVATALEKRRLPALQGGVLYLKTAMAVGTIPFRPEDTYKKLRLTRAKRPILSGHRT